jgi:YhcH/YjgK/YiaL family protein
MVIDSLKNAHIYEGLGPRIKAALDYVARTDLRTLPPGRHDIDGDQIYLLLQDYQSKRESEGQWEHHRRYIDLQYVVDGVERIGYAPAASLTAAPYDEARDIAFPTGRGSFVTVAAGDFVLLWPDDAHMPGMAAGEPAPVRKAVVKIAAA